MLATAAPGSITVTSPMMMPGTRSMPPTPLAAKEQEQTTEEHEWQQAEEHAYAREKATMSTIMGVVAVG